MKRISKVLVFLLMTVTFSLLCMPAEVNSTPFVRQYDILSNKVIVGRDAEVGGLVERSASAVTSTAALDHLRPAC